MFLSVSFKTVLRIWDCLFYEGDKILFRVGVTLVKLNSDKILKCRSFPEVMDVFRGMVTDPLVVHCHEFMQVREITSFMYFHYKFQQKNQLSVRLFLAAVLCNFFSAMLRCCLSHAGGVMLVIFFVAWCSYK